MLASALVGNARRGVEAVVEAVAGKPVVSATSHKLLPLERQRQLQQWLHPEHDETGGSDPVARGSARHESG